jgi:hypothetical protein
MLLLSGVGSVVLLARRRTRHSGIVALLIGGSIALSIFVHSETWWARYVPQAWLLPLVVVVPFLSAPRRSAHQIAGFCLVVLASANVLLIGAHVARRQLVYARETRTALEQMRVAPQPVTVYLAEFMALRQRLQEAGVQFRIIDTPEESLRVRHPIPTSGDRAFWVE